MNDEIPMRPPLAQRPPKRVKPNPRRGLTTKRPLGTKRRELAATYSQDKFLENVKAIHGWRCWLASYACAGMVEGCHVHPKRLLVDLFPKGAILLGDNCAPYEGQAEIEANARVVTLDAILLDGRNGLPLCRHHHDQVGDTWSGVDFDRFPPEVREFTATYGLTWLDGVERRKV